MFSLVTWIYWEGKPCQIPSNYGWLPTFCIKTNALLLLLSLRCLYGNCLFSLSPLCPILIHALSWLSRITENQTFKDKLCFPNWSYFTALNYSVVIWPVQSMHGQLIFQIHWVFFCVRLSGCPTLPLVQKWLTCNPPAFFACPCTSPPWLKIHMSSYRVNVRLSGFVEATFCTMVHKTKGASLAPEKEPLLRNQSSPRWGAICSSA